MNPLGMTVLFALGGGLIGGGCTRDVGAPEQGASPRDPPVSEELPTLEDPWLPVRPEEVGPEETIHWHAETGPRTLGERAPVRLPDVESSAGQSVIVRAVVSRDGHVAKAQILRGPAVEGLEEAVVKALSAWRFAPAKTRGARVAVYMNLTVPIVGTEARR